MSKPLRGSICLTDLNNLDAEGHSAFNTGTDGKRYVNCTLWDSEGIPDKYGNTFSLQANPKKDSQQSKPYIGNFKPIEPKA